MTESCPSRGRRDSTSNVNLISFIFFVVFGQAVTEVVVLLPRAIGFRSWSECQKRILALPRAEAFSNITGTFCVFPRAVSEVSSGDTLMLHVSLPFQSTSLP